MDANHTPPAMNQMIFKMGLPVETVSLYLICCGLVDSGDSLSIKNLKAVWHGTEEAFQEAIADLERLRIIRKVVSDPKGASVYRLMNLESRQEPR